MSKVLHFFPGQHKMIWVVNGVVKIRAEAWGGTSPDPLIHYNIMKPEKTTPGRYVIHSIAPYRTNTWKFSRISWGTPIKLSSDGEHVAYKTGNHIHPWKIITDVTPNEIKIMHCMVRKSFQEIGFLMTSESRLFDIIGI